MGEEEGSKKLMMWKYCARCKLRTNIVPVSDLTWSLSFAMFLQLLFSEKSMVVRGDEREDAVCTHSLHQEQLTCFGSGDQVVTFEYSKLHVLDIEMPENTLAVPQPAYTKERLTLALKECKEASSSTYSSILTSLHNTRDQVRGEFFVKRIQNQSTSSQNIHTWHSCRRQTRRRSTRPTERDLTNWRRG